MHLWRYCRGVPNALLGIIIAFYLPLSAHAECSDEMRDCLLSIKNLFEDVEYERALKELSHARLLKHGVEDAVTLSLYEGIILADLGKQKEATAAFKSALFLRPDVKFPTMVSPKVERRLEDLRKEVKQSLASPLEKRQTESQQEKAENQQRVEPPPQAEAQLQQEEQNRTPPTTQAMLASPTKVDVSARGSLRSRALLPAIAGGVLLAAGGGAWGLAKSEQAWLRSMDPGRTTLEEARRHAERGKAWQTVGFGLLGAGVVGLGAAAGLYAFGAPAKPVALSIGTNGTSAFVYGRFP